MANMKEFLENMEEGKAALLFEEGKEGEKIDASFKTALSSAKITSEWAYQPEGYDLVVMEHDKDGEKKGSWSVAFFTEAELAGKEPEEDIFKEGLSEAKVGLKLVDQIKGTFLDIVQLCIEIASKKGQYKGGFTSKRVAQAVSASKAKK
jgi:hypothetical protein